MRLAATVLIALVAALHLYFLVLEMFLWRTPFGRRTFGTTSEAAESSAVLAGNQGLYNGFLAAGLLWGLGAYGVIGGRPILTFFLACDWRRLSSLPSSRPFIIIVAGVYGAITVNRRILIVQGLPAAIAAALVWLS